MTTLQNQEMSSMSGDTCPACQELTHRRTAQTELTRVLTSLATNAYVAPQAETLAEFLTSTWLPAIEHTIKPATFESYRRNMRLHAAGRPIGRRKLQEVDPADLNALLDLVPAEQSG